MIKKTTRNLTALPSMIILQFVCVSIPTLVSPCYAFVADMHRSFSERAVVLYEACTGLEIPEEWSFAFAEGSADEDNVTPSRMLNWHFYNRDKKIGRYCILINGSNECIFHERIEALNNMFDSKAPRSEIYAMAGH